MRSVNLAPDGFPGDQEAKMNALFRDRKCKTPASDVAAGIKKFPDAHVVVTTEGWR